MIEASLEFGFHSRHSNFNFLNNVESYKLGLLLNPNSQKMHRNLT